MDLSGSLFGGGNTGFNDFNVGGGVNTNNLMALLSGGMGQYQKFIQNPTQSPLFQNQLGGLLAALQPGEQRAQTNLMDMFRSAGNMASGAYGTAAGNLQGELQRNRQVTASQLLGQMFPQMTQALQGPMSIYSNLLQALIGKGGAGGAGLGGPSLGTPTFGEPGYDPWGFSTGPYPSKS